MKKKLILLIILCLGAVFALTSCGGSGTDTGECAHEYKIAKKQMPTCTDDGFTVFECTLCHKETPVVLEAKGHDFITTFTWSEDNTHASVLLECKTDASHVYNVSSTIKEEIKEPSCKEVGKQIITATVTWGEKTYTDTKEYNLGLGECQNTYKFSLKGESCIDGFDMEKTCSACQKTSHASFDSHVLFDMAHFPACGGEAVVNICPCGEMVELSHPRLCTAEVEDTKTEVDENGTVYTVEHRFCVRCDLEIIYKNHSTIDGCYTYHHRQTSIVDKEKVLYSFSEPNYEVESFHELTYNYDGGKIDSCENGFEATASCKLCGYTEKLSQNTHALKPVTEKIDLEAYGVCGGYLLIKKCPCEKESDVSYSLSCDYEYSYSEETVNGELHTVKTYTCDKCKTEFIYDQYIKNGAVAGIWRVTVNGEVKYELTLSY